MKVIGYKGTDCLGRCHGFQYEVGKTYECDEAKLCESGFHFCLRPLDVFRFYPPRDRSRYFMIEAELEEEKRRYPSLVRMNYGAGPDAITKRVTKKITILRELTLEEFYQEEIKYHEASKQKSEYTASDNNYLSNSFIFDDYCKSNIHGGPSKTIAGNDTYTSSEQGSTTISGFNGVAASKRGSIVVSGYDGLSLSEDDSVSISEDYGNAVSSKRGISVSKGNSTSLSGDNGISACISGYSETKDFGISVAKEFGFAKSGEDGMSIGGVLTTVESGDQGISVSKEGKSSAGMNGVSISRSSYPLAKGDIGCVIVLILTEFVNSHPNDSIESDSNPLSNIQYKSFKIDGEKYKPNVWYTLTADGEIVEETVDLLKKVKYALEDAASKYVFNFDETLINAKEEKE